jgi:hypothetical protein
MCRSRALVPYIAFFVRLFQDQMMLKHPLHKDMVKNVDRIFADFPNLIHIAAHEPGFR